MLRQAQELQARLAKAQAEIAQMTTEASAGGGAVTVVIDGALKVKSVKIAPEVAKEDVEMLQDLVTAAVNEAIAKSQEMASQKLSAITGGLKIPGM